MPVWLVQVLAMLATAYRRGPRPSLMWAVVCIFLAIAWRVASGGTLPDAGTLMALLSSAGAAGAYLAHLRSNEYARGVANDTPSPLVAASADTVRAYAGDAPGAAA